MWSTSTKRVLQLIFHWSLISRTFKNLAKYLTLKVHKYVYLDIDRYFSTKFSYIPRRGSGNGMPSDVPLPLWVALINPTRPQWKATLKEMEKIWKILIGCTLLLIPYVRETLLAFMNANDRSADYQLLYYRSTWCAPHGGAKCLFQQHLQSP